MSRRILCGFLFIILAFSMNTGCTTPDNSIYWLHYVADYEDPLDLLDIDAELQNHSIVTSMKNNYLHCEYGSSSNNTTIEGTTCTITEIDGYYSYNVRLTLFHGRESTVKELEQHKPALIDSMEYLMSMIYNATGKEPHEMRFIIEDAWD